MDEFYKWLWKYQKIGRRWFNTMTPDKKPYIEEYKKYRQKVKDFQKAVTLNECREVAHELVLLGN